MKRIAILLAAFVLISATAFSQKKSKKEKLSKMDKEFLEKQPDGLYAKIETSKGTMYALLEAKEVPMTVSNFVGLAEGTITNTAKPAGTPYYDGLIFHRVIPGFMIQGGCPQGTGGGDPGYKFPDELDKSLEVAKRGYLRGTLAMANAGPNTNGSQFFIMHQDYALPYSYSIFGKVVQGIEVVDSIVASPRNQGDRPNQDQTILHMTILRKGKDAEAFDAAKTFEFEKGNIAVKAEAKAKAAREAMDKVLKEKYANAQTTPSGLKYIIQTPGTGEAPKPNSTVTVHYVGTFLDGTKFDSSVDRGQPATFPLDRVISGWTEGLQLLKPGGKITLVIPPNLAYGEAGRPGIPPSSWLAFEVELISVEGQAAPGK